MVAVIFLSVSSSERRYVRVPIWLIPIAMSMTLLNSTGSAVAAVADPSSRQLLRAADAPVTTSSNPPSALSRGVKADIGQLTDRGTLRIVVRGTPWSWRPHVVVKGPPQQRGGKRYRKRVPRISSKLSGLKPGRYRVVATRVQVLGGVARPTKRSTRVRVRSGKTARVVVKYWTTWPKIPFPYRIDEIQWPGTRLAARKLLQRLPDRIQGLRLDRFFEQSAPDEFWPDAPEKRLYLTADGDPAAVVVLGAQSHQRNSLVGIADLVGQDCRSRSGSRIYQRIYATLLRDRDWLSLIDRVDTLRTRDTGWLRCTIPSPANFIATRHQISWSTPDGRINYVSSISKEYRRGIVGALVAAADPTAATALRSTDRPGSLAQPAVLSAAVPASKTSTLTEGGAPGAALVRTGAGASGAVVAVRAARAQPGGLRIVVPGKLYRADGRYVITGPARRMGEQRLRIVRSGSRTVSGLRPGEYRVVARGFDHLGGRAEPKRRVQDVRVFAGNTARVVIRYRTRWPEGPDPHGLAATEWPRTLGGWESLLAGAADRVGGTGTYLSVESGLELGDGRGRTSHVGMGTLINGSEASADASIGSLYQGTKVEQTVSFPPNLALWGRFGRPGGCRDAVGSRAYRPLFRAISAGDRNRFGKRLDQFWLVRSRGFFWLQCTSTGSIDNNDRHVTGLLAWAGHGPARVSVAAERVRDRDKLRDALVAEQRQSG